MSTSTDLIKNGEPSSSSSSSSSSSPAPSGSASAPSIPLYLINGVATIWDAQTAATLHCTHAVSGLRVGTLPGVAQQNGFLGLPVTLMQEETAYLVQQGIAHLIPLNTTPTLPSAEDIAAHTAARRARNLALEQRAREEEASRAAVSWAAYEKGGEKARAKREARARAKALKAQTTDAGTQSQSQSAETLFEQGAKESAVTDQTPTSTPAPGYFHAFPSHPFHPTLLHREPITSLPHPLFPFPSTPRDRALVSVYTTLAQRGLRMGLGPRFGGEYLIYPGDYLRYHAHFTSQVVVRDQPIRPAEIVAWGRLGTGTKKAGLLCCWDDSVRTDTPADDEGEVDFYSLEWANFG